MRLLIAIMLACAGCASFPGPASTPKAQPASRAAVLPADSGCPPSPSANCTQPCPPGSPVPCDECASYHPAGPYPSGDCGCKCEEGLLCDDKTPLPAPDARWPVCDPQTLTPCGFIPGPPPPGVVRFAAIGDWGDLICSQTCAHTVADMVNSWKQYGVDFIMTTGDNNYPDGTAADLVTHMALYSNWSPWASPGACPKPGDPPPANPPRFFPTLGNHDLITCCGQPYLDFFCGLTAFSSSGNARYYNYARPDGLIEIFSLNPDHDPDGTDPNSKQAQWFREALKNSKAAWKVVIFHEPTVGTSQQEGFNDAFKSWDFAGWGASVVLTGHKHLYERILDPTTNLTYITNGLGGTTGLASIRDGKFGPTDDQGCGYFLAAGSQVRFNRSVGALIGSATSSELHFCFLVPTADHPEGVCIDNFFVPPTKSSSSRP